MTRNHFDRRNFLTRSLAASAAAATWGGVHVNPTPSKAADSPNERLNLVAIGATNRAGANIAGCRSENIIAISDVDANLLAKGTSEYPDAKGYRDFRVMLEKEADRIDGVLVGTPDHTHAPAAAMALRMKKHVYCEKPLTHTVHECRVLSDLAKANRLVTQMGTQIHAGANYRRVVELIQSGAIGPVQEVHVWVPTDYSGGKLTTGTPTPAGLDWDLWLGPCAKRPYSDGVHPFHWRRFWDFGTGSLGDFGCHYMDLPFWALGLRAPSSVAARGPEADPVSPPQWLIVDYDFPARGDMPPVRMTWYDGGKSPVFARPTQGSRRQSTRLEVRPAIRRTRWYVDFRLWATLTPSRRKIRRFQSPRTDDTGIDWSSRRMAAGNPNRGTNNLQFRLFRCLNRSSTSRRRRLPIGRYDPVGR